MTNLSRLALCLGVLVLALTGCDRNAEQRRILHSQLAESDSSRTMLTQTIAGRRTQLALLDQQLTQQRFEIDQFQGRVQAYVMDHKMATLALAAGVAGAGVAYDANNQFTAAEENAAAGVALAAGLYALANAEEVMQVADQLMQADAHLRNLQAQAQTTEQQLQSEAARLQQEEQQLLDVNRHSADLRQQLAAL